MGLQPRRSSALIRRRTLVVRPYRRRLCVRSRTLGCPSGVGLQVTQRPPGRLGKFAATPAFGHYLEDGRQACSAPQGY